MKLKKWVKVSLLIMSETLTIIFMLKTNTNITFNMNLLLTCGLIVCENLIMFIEGE